MNTLIVCPKSPEKFWSFTNDIKSTSKKSTTPLKESLIISISLPLTWERKRIDLNKEKLEKKDILWADYIFVHANEKQFKSALATIKKCKSFGKKIVACGSLFTEFPEEFENVDHLVLDDIRKTLPMLINDLEEKSTKKVYHSNPFFEIRKSTESYYSLKSISGALSQNIQFSHV